MKFNPFLGNFDFTGASSGSPYWKDAVPTEADLALVSSPIDGEARVALDTNKVYVYDSGDDRWYEAGISIGSFGSSPNANGISLTLVDNDPVLNRTLILQPADSTNPGSLSITAQNIAGEKTFLETIYGSKHLILGSATIDPSAFKNIVLGDADLQAGAIQVLSVGTSHIINGDQSIVYGSQNTLNPGSNNIVGGDSNTNSGSFNSIFGQNISISGDYNSSTGNGHTITASKTHSEGDNNQISASYAHAEGSSNIASGTASHVEGNTNTASGPNSHAEGLATTASADSAHAEGVSTLAASVGSHAEGQSTIAGGSYAHAEGSSSEAYGNYSHAANLGTLTNSDNQTAVGQYNTSSGTPGDPQASDQIFTVGYGVDSSNRADAFFVQRDGIASFTENVLLNGTPSTSLHAVNKQYVDSIAQGIKWKQSVRAATTGDITLSGEQTIDTVAVVTGERVLVKDQLTDSENGIYIVDSGAWTRSTDADSGTELDSAAVAVEEGGNAGRGYLQTAQNVNIGTDSITFYQIFGPGAYTADGQGIEVSGVTFSLELDGSTLSKSASGLKIASGGITDTEINASAGIDASKIADGSVSSTEFQYINSLTSNAQTQIDGKANRDLSNLTSPTAFNQHLLPDGTNTRDVGSTTFRLRNVISDKFTVYNGSNTLIEVLSSATKPSGSSVPSIRNPNLADHLAIFTADNSSTTGSLYLETGNVVSGSSNSGDINLKTGTISSGTRGKINLDGSYIDANSTKIQNVTDPTSAQDAATKNYVDGFTSPGDIVETSFSAANNQATPANITGFAFANATVRSFKAIMSVYIDATTPLYEVFDVIGIQKGSSWDISTSSTGDTSNIVLSITNAGQIQYTSGNETGFVSSTFKFRAITTSV